MFFHIDEAGNTGNNLFDFEQPRLSYGVLSSARNADVLCAGIHRKIKREIGDTQIHANKLGLKGLLKIAPDLIDIQRKCNSISIITSSRNRIMFLYCFSMQFLMRG